MRAVSYTHLDVYKRQVQWLPRHKYAENAVRCRVNVQLGGVRVALGLERNKVVRVILHFRQPVHDKFVVLARCQADLGQFFAEKIRCVRSGDAEALGAVSYTHLDVYKRQEKV